MRNLYQNATRLRSTYPLKTAKSPKILLMSHILELTAKGRPDYVLEELVSRIAPENKHDFRETDFGEVGREAVSASGSAGISDK